MNQITLFFNNRIKKFFGFLSLFFAIITLVFFILALFNIYFIYINFEVFCTCGFFFVSLPFSIYFCVNVIKKKWIKLLILLFLILINFFGIFIVSLILMFNPKYKIYNSYLNNNKIIVLDDSFIISCYSAYPVKYNFFYQKENNGFLAYDDFWGNFEHVEVEWSKKEAIIKIQHSNFQPLINSNKTDYIKVTFK